MPKAGCFCRRWLVAFATVALCCVQVVARTAVASSPAGIFSCFSLQCGMPAHGAFPNFVVGRIAAIADAGQAAVLFDGMRQRGHWANLPAKNGLFWKNLQPVAIDTGHGVVMVALTSQSEIHAAPLNVGDFVRYSPHRGKYEVPPTDKVAAKYWHVGGCVAILCRAGDRKCIKRYASGVYRATDGVQLSSHSLAPLGRGAVINIRTMVPQHIGATN